MQAKPAWQSKGMWLGALGLALVVLQVLAVNGHGILPDAWIQWIGLIGLVLSGVNRYVASQPIAGSPADQPPG